MDIEEGVSSHPTGEEITPQLLGPNELPSAVLTFTI